MRNQLLILDWKNHDIKSNIIHYFVLLMNSYLQLREGIPLKHLSPWSSLYFHCAFGQIFTKHLKKSDTVKKSKLLNGVAVAV